MKLIYSLALAAMMAIGLTGTASAGGGPPPDPGPLSCGDEDEQCFNGYLWEWSYKCDDDWEDDGTVLNIPGEYLYLRAEEKDGGYGDCRFNSYLEGDDDVAKYEAKCELENGDKVEFELKNKGVCID